VRGSVLARCAGENPASAAGICGALGHAAGACRLVFFVTKR
jgi:hypothetical protein